MAIITISRGSYSGGKAVAELARGVAGVKALHSEVGMGADWHW